MKKSERSVAEIEMEKILNETEDIIDETYLTTNDAKGVLKAGWKLLVKCEELRISRDNWCKKYKTLQTKLNKQDF